ncbi:MAG: type II toxin-antitoxin system VapC family toxin [Cyanobacteria bacterium REEB65]|nr:type II toxin-antitoxin system VapC family toxin [Cyanobacteria bacterium REEB65]
MAVVLDASVALAWCFADAESPAAFKILEDVQAEGAIVPAIWPLEVANALLTAQRRGRLDPVTLPALADELGALPILVESRSPREILTNVCPPASEYRLSAYDAAYLDLARRKCLPLATMDERLAAACRNAGVETLGFGSANVRAP